MSAAIDIQVKAQQLVYQSRGKLTHAEALAELSKRGTRKRRQNRPAKFGNITLSRAFVPVESPRSFLND